MVGDDDETSSSAEESEEKRETKKDKKRGKKDTKSKTDAKKSKKTDKKSKKKGKKRKNAPGSDSSSSAGKKKKKKKDGKEGKGEVVQEAWIFNRAKAIRKGDSSISKDDALKQAVAEYCTVFEGGSSLPDAGPKKPEDEILAGFTDGPVADAVREAVRQACDEAREAGKSDEEIKTEAKKAKDSVLTVATSAGLYDPTTAKAGQEQQTSLFLQSHEKQLVDYVKHGMPTTGNRSLEAVLDSWRPREIELEEGAARRAEASMLGNKFVSDGTQSHSI